MALPGMSQNKSAADLLYALEVTRQVDILDILDAAEEIARREGAVRLDGRHIHQALVAMAGKQALLEREEEGNG